MKLTRVLAGTLLLALVAMPVWAQGLPMSSPEDVGLSSERLERIGPFLQRHIDSELISGSVVMVARNGRVAYHEAFGELDMDADTPMAKDSIFRIYSMTKPITSLAVMMLWEEGLFLLNDPVSKYIPELGGLQMGTDGVGADGRPEFATMRSSRDMTIRDLLRHTSGLTYGIFGASTVDKMYNEQELLNSGSLAEFVNTLSKLPLRYDPGTTWNYSVSTDVLGRFVEVISGMPFDQFLEERIFLPLEMNDTAFWVPESKAHRLTTLYTPNGVDDLTLKEMETDAVARDYREPPPAPSGGGGLLSTATDYVRFCQMLLNGGELGGVRLLGTHTVEMMTRDHLGDIEMGLGAEGHGFGLGFMINADLGTMGATAHEGTFSWGGYAHTRFWVDPVDDLIGIFMIQILPSSAVDYGDKFKSLVYQSILE